MRLIPVLAPALCLCASAPAIELPKSGLQPQDLRHLGTIRVPASPPAGQSWRSSFSYGGTALAFNPKRNSLFLVGHDHQQMVAEVSIPNPVRAEVVANLPTAEMLQPFADVTGGRCNNKIGGLLVFGDRLLWTTYVYYDAAAAAKTSHGVSTLDLAQPAARGVFSLGGMPAGAVAGCMSLVPDEWKDKLGVSVLTGQAGIPIVSRTSAGPAAVGFDPEKLGEKPVPAVPLVYYPLQRPLGPLTEENSHWNLACSLAGMAFVSKGGREALIFVGRRGLGDYWYGEPEHDGKKDPHHTSKGPHAPPYEASVWLYDPNDLLQVKLGRKQSWQVRPYHVGPLPGFLPSGLPTPGGVAYDPQAGRLYVSQLSGEQRGYDFLPLIHVYSIGDLSQ